MSEQQLFKVHRPIMLRGTEYAAGEVIDLAPMRLPPGRAQQLVDQRRGELLSAADEITAPDTADELITEWAVQDAPLDPTPEPIVVDVDSDDGLSEPLADDEARLVEGWRSMTRHELQAAAKAQGIPAGGKNEDILQRLIDSLG